ncbi:MAG: hypothetical protein ACHRHE_06945 [Tepidisphaerales bacterium]
MSAIAQSSSTGWQTGFLRVLPVVRTHARIQFRYLRAERREDAIQEAIASACVSYQLLAARGRLHVARPSVLATFAVRHVRDGRHVGGHQDSAKDPLSPVCQRRHGVQVVSLERHRVPPRAGYGSDGWRQLTIADRRDPIPETVAFRIDFGQWLKMLGRRDRRIVTAFIRGERTTDVAGKLGVTLGRVSQLRRRYERDWARFQRQAA